MSNYAKGANRERLFIKMLLKGWNGWPPALWAARTAGSHSKVDVMSIFPDVVRIFQLKSGAGRIGEDEMIVLAGLARTGTVEAYCIEWPDFEPPLIRRVR